VDPHRRRPEDDTKPIRVPRNLRAREDLPAFFFEFSPDPSAVIDAGGRLLAVNDAARRAGAPGPEASPPPFAPPFWTSSEERAAFLSAIPDGGFRDRAVLLPELKAGTTTRYLVSAVAVGSGPAAQIVATARASERTAGARGGPMTDPLTGLPGREPFRALLERMVEAPRPAGTSVSLTAFDLDAFKTINETHGLDAGDEYLRQLGTTLRTTFGPGALLGRVSGDAFALARSGVTQREALDEAQRLRSVLISFAPSHGGHPLQLTASVGVALLPEHAARPLDLMLAADEAMREAKEKGRGWLVLHDPKKRDPQKSASLRDQANVVRRALSGGRIVPFYQPIAEVQTGVIVAVETLARIRGEDGQLVEADRFVEAAERFGLVTELDHAVIAAAFDDFSQARRSLPLAFEMSINLSGLDFEDDTLVGDISRLARARGIRPERITFEITETAALRDLGRVIQFTHALTSEGFRFSLDDFGLGFSSFRYLRELPLSTLKFDRSYVQTIVTEPRSRVFVKGVAEICRGFGIKTVAEGVEDQNVLSVLGSLGVDRAQGFLVGAPSPGLPLSFSGERPSLSRARER
jgi:diguanylate cyclase (GGDEF)-like protein